MASIKVVALMVGGNGGKGQKSRGRNSVTSGRKSDAATLGCL